MNLPGEWTMRSRRWRILRNGGEFTVFGQEERPGTMGFFSLPPLCRAHSSHRSTELVGGMEKFAAS